MRHASRPATVEPSSEPSLRLRPGDLRWRGMAQGMGAAWVLGEAVCSPEMSTHPGSGRRVVVFSACSSGVRYRFHPWFQAPAGGQAGQQQVKEAPSKTFVT